MASKTGSMALYGVTGHPLSHTYSPVIHHYLFKKYKINARYDAFPAEPKAFKSLMLMFKKTGLRGFNITVPYKTAVMKHCQILHAEAKAIGAVNTVILCGKKWHGYVTDPVGFEQAVKNAFKGFSFKGHRILVLGAGGAALSVVYVSLKSQAAETVVMNRTISHARRIEKRMTSLGLRNIKIVGYDKKFLEEDCAFDLIVNCTSVGLKKGDPSVLDLAHTWKGTKVFDLIYNPALTPFLAQAKKRKLAYVNGLGMLIYQAFASFTIWTGVKPTVQDAKVLMGMLKR